ncbi:MAG: hypothetical protein ABW179_01045 [Methylobacterium sp.]
MTRYFFDIHDGIVVTDETGLELPNIEAANTYAMKIVSDYAAKPGMVGIDGGVMVVTIRDGVESVLMRFRLVFNVEDFTENGRRA